MRKNGFTLIELLAVIVILAIIALIATPVILEIIEDSRVSLNKRSVDMYAKAIENQISKSQLNNEVITPGNLDSTFLNKLEYDGNRVVCEINKLNADGTIYLSGCTVDGKEVDYTYGTEKTNSPSYQQKFKPDYYFVYDVIGNFNMDAPENPLTSPPEGQQKYIGYDIYNGKVSNIYVCFVKNGNEYCLKGESSHKTEDNFAVVNDAFSDVINDENYCGYQSSTFMCTDNYSYDNYIYRVQISENDLSANSNDFYVCFINNSWNTFGCVID